MEMDLLLSQIIAGLTRGSIYYLMIVGMTLLYGVLGVLNVAHVSFFAIGAYVTYMFWAMLQDYTFSYWVAIPLTLLTMAAIGLFIEFVLMRLLYKRIMVESLLATFGLIYVFTDLIKIVFGVSGFSIKSPILAHSLMTIGATTVSVATVFTIAVALVVAGLLWFWLEKTRTGKIVVATQSDREMVSALGFRVPLIYTSLFVVSAIMAGLAGAMWMATGVAQPYRLDMPMLGPAFVILVVGGMDSMRGTFLAAMLMGVIFALSVVFFPRGGMLIIYAVALLVLAFRPWGFFGTKGRLM